MTLMGTRLCQLKFDWRWWCKSTESDLKNTPQYHWVLNMIKKNEKYFGYEISLVTFWIALFFLANLLKRFFVVVFIIIKTFFLRIDIMNTLNQTRSMRKLMHRKIEIWKYDFLLLLLQVCYLIHFSRFLMAWRASKLTIRVHLAVAYSADRKKN